MFGIGAPVREDRSEPLPAFLGAAAAPAPLLPRSPGRLASDSPIERRREPALPTVPPTRPALPALPERERPAGSREPGRPFGPIGSLVLHLLPLLLLLDWPMHPPAEIAPIPVRLIIEPPPPPPKSQAPKPEAPKPVAPKPKPEPPPPRGRIASADLGDTAAKAKDPEKSEAPTADKQPATVMESPLEAPQRTAFLPPPPLLPEPPELILPKPPEPYAAAPPKPPQKPSPAVHQPVRRMPQQAHLMPRPARFPGPAATRDEYLAYLARLARQHLNLISPALLGNRRGQTVIDVLVLDDGTIAMLRVGQSSGYPDIDRRVEQMVVAVGRFPPLPQWFQGPSMALEFKLSFPEALEN